MKILKKWIWAIKLIKVVKNKKVKVALEFSELAIQGQENYQNVVLKNKEVFLKASRATKVTPTFPIQNKKMKKNCILKIRAKTSTIGRQCKESKRNKI